MRLKKNITLVFVLSLASIFTPAFSQILREADPVPQGAVIYSLPETSIRVQVKAKTTTFTAGPYAAYAEKYLGTPAQRNNSATCTIEQINIVPLVQADPSVTISLNLGSSKNASANFLNFSSQGLIVAAGYFSSYNAPLRFPSAESAKFNEAVPHLGTKTTQLYKSVTNEEGEVERVAVPQVQTVEKSTEKKAEETAQIIFKLKQKKLDILTGDTDANYSGEALGAAVAEIEKLEAEYTSLFLGKSVSVYQEAYYDVVPKAQNSSQRYVAFRISDSQGLLTSDNMAGRPVYLELTPETRIDGGISEADIAASKGKIVYRTPVIVSARMLDGKTVLGESRLPVYQFGRIAFFPMDLATGR